MHFDLSGTWQAELEDGSTWPMELPGTLDTNEIGFPDEAPESWHPAVELGNADSRFAVKGPIRSRFTRNHTYEGPVRISRRVHVEPEAGHRLFVDVDRARHLQLLVDGAPVSVIDSGDITTPYSFEVTGLLTGDNELTFISDNSYPGWPAAAIKGSSAATEETQTNWNGLIGNVGIRAEPRVFISAVNILPIALDRMRVRVRIDAGADFDGELQVRSAALAQTAVVRVSMSEGDVDEIEFDSLTMKEGLDYWDEDEGNLYGVSVALLGSGGDCPAEKNVQFGVRVFGDDGSGHLALNGRRVFVRSEANCAVFPETGHPPMTVEEWREILAVFKSYGVNLMRFHSHCPPEVAFQAADEMGMMMQPELSHWDPESAFEADESYEYYRAELEQTLQLLANHPSFVALTLGNELCTGELGHERMAELILFAKELDPTRLYSNGSNVHYGFEGADPGSDFYTSQAFVSAELGIGDAARTSEHMTLMATIDRPYLRGTFACTSRDLQPGIQGHINKNYPNASTNYNVGIEALRCEYSKPVFGFEVGQFQSLPDFDELAEFKGVTKPDNLKVVQQEMQDRGLARKWRDYVEATGELALIAYREESEAALRTKDFSGLSLLGVQDFPGQGTALVGMLNSHLEPKPYPFADPERFAAFFTSELPLVLLEKYTYVSGEILHAPVEVANYGKSNLNGTLRVRLVPDSASDDEQSSLGLEWNDVTAPAGELTVAGVVEFNVPDVETSSRYDLEVEFCGLKNTYPLWVYPDVTPSLPEGVLEVATLDEEVIAKLEQGATVFLAPPATADAIPNSLPTQFTTDFWSVRTFPEQEGTMGQLIDTGHPIFEDFPTESHTNWQWWPMASTRAIRVPQDLQPIVTEMDSYAFLRPLAQLFEVRVGKGRLLVSTMGLQDLRMYPEGRALLSSVYRYLGSSQFEPTYSMTTEGLRELWN